MGYMGDSILLAPMSLVESIVFYTMVLRVLAVAFIPRVRRTNSQVKIALFSFETFVLVGLIFTYIYTLDRGYDILIGQLLTAWIGVSCLVLTPYLVYQIGYSMHKGMSAASLTLAVTPEYAVNLFLAGLAISLTSPPNGIVDFGSMLIGSIKVQSTFENAQLLGTNAFFASITVVLYISLVLYIGMCQYSTSFVAFAEAIKYQYQLLLILAGTVIVFIWILLSPILLGGNEAIILCIPAIAITSVLLGATRRGREKK